MTTYADFTNNTSTGAIRPPARLSDASDGMHVDGDMEMDVKDADSDSTHGVSDLQLRVMINTIRSEHGRPHTLAALFDLFDQCIPVFLSPAVCAHLSINLANGDAGILRFILSREPAFHGSADVTAKSLEPYVLHLQSWTAFTVLRLIADHWPEVFRNLALSSNPARSARGGTDIVRDIDMSPIAYGAAESRWANPTKMTMRRLNVRASMNGRQHLEDTRLHANRVASLLEVFEEPETSRNGAEDWSIPRWMQTIDDIERLLCASGLMDGERLQMASELCDIGRELVGRGRNVSEAIRPDEYGR